MDLKPNVHHGANIRLRQAGWLALLGAGLLVWLVHLQAATRCQLVNDTLFLCAGAATPESAVTAPAGSVFFRSDGAAGTTVYVKETGTGNTGWVAVPSGGAGADVVWDNVLAVSATAPTVGSGFGTSPAVTGTRTAAFTVNVGTGGTASSGVLTLPTATTGWICHVENLTGVAANRADQRTVQTATTTTSVTVQNQTISTGAALAWTASDVLTLQCVGY